MLDLESFLKIFPKSFTKKLNESIIPHNYPLNRNEIAHNLYKELTEFRYHPSTPRDYIIINKGNHVARISPTFYPKDYFVYYFCTKVLEDEIAVNYVEGTYGGWRLGNKIKLREVSDDLELSDSAPSNSYNPFLWSENWSDFQKKAFENNNLEEFKYVVKLDIANFYDNVNIDLLSKKLHLAAPKNKTFYIDLLIHFLNNWNKKFQGYSKKSVGLPQDEISDSSRLLANFYLQDYDKEIKNRCDSLKAKYLRYADDQLFYTKSLQDAQFLVYETSKLLSRIGLNINAGKVEYFDNPEKFNQYWAFELFELLGDKNNKENINIGIKKFIEWKDKKISFKEHSVLRRILNQDFKLFETSSKHKVLAYLFDKEFISMMNNWSMSKVYEQLNSEDRIEFLRILDNLINENHFNSFHYNLIKFYEKNSIPFDKQRILNRIEILKI